MKTLLLMILVVTSMGLSTAGSAVADQARTEGEVAQDLVGRLLQPVLDALAANPGVEGVAIRKPLGLVPGVSVHEVIGNFLYDRGYEVFTLDSQMAVPEGAVVLDLEVKVAGFDYPREKGGFLGLGRSRLLRRGALGVSGRLEDPVDGRWLWRGSPQVQDEEWVAKREREALSADRPPWMAGSPLPAVGREIHWWERGLIAGLLTGVIVLYLDGTQ